ncbi:hypothetical protein POX_b02005 [Penicillium oxalicum]|uniref:Uncharacterized protein n=1 Tax=Penicillium oxalicum (strain 114-2 / CGMCC 5302) TaxID=933388 RepID=S7ZK50_PENO1|nr:hypothetical protein POX_b02005 [Penicillium oxalicum]EPS31005.1 hypothetical protein PDE_05959 [Penicillium oxalicum 114-2]KAI2791976.1 hypothetical protein POX_b02005 [Penicillium oxalicum]
MALVRDPYFWKRFSTAVHLQEIEAKSDAECISPVRKSDSWLDRERRKRKRTLIWGFVIFFGVLLVVIGAIIVWWLARHHWMQRIEP